MKLCMVPASICSGAVILNNVRILKAAREVFIANPAAPISEVAIRAGVGIAALYHRYPSKNALLAQLCLDGQDTYIELVEKALASTDDPWRTSVQSQL